MKSLFKYILLIAVFMTNSIYGQVYTYKKKENGKEVFHRILMDENYYVETQFSKNPNQFIKSVGGYFKKNKEGIIVDLEFNSNFSKDSIKSISISNMLNWNKISKKSSLLEGKWLMAGRVIGEIEKRRDIHRKNNDWYHSGFSSKGDPLHEIWTSRNE